MWNESENVYFDRPKSPNILVIDDDHLLGECMRWLLEGSGFNCQRVTDMAGVQKAVEQGFQPDVVVTDLDLNPESGCDVLEYFRSHKCYPLVPVLLISSDQAGPGVAAEKNFSGFLAKCFLLQNLLKWVHHLLNAAREQKNA